MTKGLLRVAYTEMLLPEALFKSLIHISVMLPDFSSNAIERRVLYLSHTL